jgi:hypothetical protein
MRFTAATLAIGASSAAILDESRRPLLKNKDSTLSGPSRRVRLDRRDMRSLTFGDTKSMWEGRSISSDDLSTIYFKDRECNLVVGILRCGSDEQCIPSPKS